jgi:hypothetical protein
VIYRLHTEHDGICGKLNVATPACNLVPHFSDLFVINPWWVANGRLTQEILDSFSEFKVWSVHNQCGK